MKNYLAAVLVAGIMVMTAGGAFAAGLDAGKVENFIATMAPVNELGVEMKNQVRDPAMNDQAPAGRSGDFSPYATSVAMLKTKYADDYKRLAEIVGKQGFASAEEWAATGDAVMRSYIALKTEQANPDYAAMQERITPEMIEQMPPEARAGMEANMKMMQSLKATPAADKAVVAPLIPKIEQAMGAGAPATGSASAPQGGVMPSTP